MNDEQIIQRGIRDLCYIGLGIILVLATLIALVAWGINTIDEKPRFSEPKVIANGKKYEPRPVPMTTKVPDQLKELSQYEIINRITE